MEDSRSIELQREEQRVQAQEHMMNAPGGNACQVAINDLETHMKRQIQPNFASFVQPSSPRLTYDAPAGNNEATACYYSQYARYAHQTN